jgi:uncharacterized protein CbrC (UPF0167 family)
MKNQLGGVAMQKLLKFQIALFKHAVASGDIEKEREAETELREAFASFGIDAETINYLIAGFKRSVKIEQAYQRKCEELREVRELISKAYRMLF